ncbi:hypothetical protein AKG60_18275 [Vibrio parahaemolyticus]|uniref:Uncharacterized protein n=1 Tax=Vibrio parahaemolyticus TaxID=670 RepID=A0AAX0M9W1_VIBPH|nr:hypothetical protein [Vibrio vulnificus]EGQ8892833.1 hypothetical protein [Vibrio parahaemolyticus]MCS0331217.1 hypothetical protein [Vibrio diabolicus]ARN69315.1 hypothetical protein FORC36_4798 [Vibrio vulnificus]KOF24121.1 hypothetical protein ACX13_23770 [Vibrio parahaemolyticus]MCS0405846.1 hypothetical protein [Vibrio diabolicus]
MSDTFIINKNTTVDDAKGMKARLDKASSKKDFLLNKPSAISYRAKLALLSLLFVIALIVEGFVLFFDKSIAIQTDLALKINDQFTISEISSGYYTHLILLIAVASLSYVFLYFDNRSCSKYKKEYLELDSRLKEIIENNENPFNDEKIYRIEDIEDLSVLICVFMATLTAMSLFVSVLKFNHYDDYLKEVKGSGELYSIHYNRSFLSDGFTLFEEKDGEIIKTEIPSGVPVKIMQINESEKGRFEYYYRTHNNRILSKEKRSAEYYLTVYLPKEMNIEGSKML